MPLAPDPLLVGRYAVFVAACELIPVPLLDGWVENRLRRALVRAQARRHDLTLDEVEVRTLADRVSGGCWGMVKAVVLWPIKKLLKTVTTVFMVKGIADVAAEMVHRALMLDEAMNQGLLPGRAADVRRAMEATLDHVDTRWLERSLMGRLRRPRGRFNGVVWASVQSARAPEGSPPVGLSAEVVEAIRVTGVVPEVLHWFHLELEHPDGIPRSEEPSEAAPSERP